MTALAVERGLGLLEDGCQALGAVDSDGVRLGARPHPCAFAFYANKQLTTGEGGILIPPDAKSRGGCAASAIRAARPTWGGSSTTGSGSTTG